MFAKLGQLLAIRPDLPPPEALGELSRLHRAARPLTAAEVREAIELALRASAVHATDGRASSFLDAAFAELDDQPLGSASIAQAHVARLYDGRDVAIKVRRPGLEDLVGGDLAIMQWLVRVAQRRTAWGRDRRPRHHPHATSRRHRPTDHRGAHLATAPDEIERALARWMAAHLVPGLPSADALIELLRLSSSLGTRLPPQASTMFRALATLAGSLEHRCPGYPLIEPVAEQGSGQVAQTLAPNSLNERVQESGPSSVPS